MTDFKNCVKLHGRRNRDGRGGGCRPNIFADHKNLYIKNENEKKDVKFVFSCNVFFVKFTGVIFANRDNCLQGVKD